MRGFLFDNENNDLRSSEKMAAVARHRPVRPVSTLWAWIANHSGQERIVSVDLPLPTGRTRALQLVTNRRAEAARWTTLARRYSDVEGAAVTLTQYARVLPAIAQEARKEQQCP
jgi:hypothetical protein